VFAVSRGTALPVAEMKRDCGLLFTWRTALGVAEMKRDPVFAVSRGTA
jgi:hypothetical protein